MMRVVIADDEAPARQRLRLLLVAHPDLEIAGEAETGTQTMELVAATKPHLLLLDIQMAEGTGLDVAACLPTPRPAIIFCTAFDQHAVDAFELNAVDYLLKPVSRVRLEKALARIPAGAARGCEAALDEVSRSQQQRLSRFLVRSGTHYLVVPAGKAAYFESTDGLTRLVTEGGQGYWMDPPLQELEARVDTSVFFRISRAAIVNLNAVVEVHPLPGGAAEVMLKSGARLEVSRRRLRDLMQRLQRG